MKNHESIENYLSVWVLIFKPWGWTLEPWGPKMTKLSVKFHGEHDPLTIHSTAELDLKMQTETLIILLFSHYTDAMNFHGSWTGNHRFIGFHVKFLPCFAGDFLGSTSSLAIVSGFRADPAFQNGTTNGCELKLGKDGYGSTLSPPQSGLCNYYCLIMFDMVEIEALSAIVVWYSLIMFHTQNN